jgi:HAD superfamily hydrolase (TIGR01549 family)
MIYEAIIFDLDVTLIHTKPEHRYTLVGRVFDELGIEITKGYIDRFWHEGGRSKMLKDEVGVDPAAFWEIYRKYDTIELRSGYLEVFDDVVEVLKELKGKYKIGLVTSAPLYIAEYEVGLIGREYFDAIISCNSTNGYRPKPDPQGINECLKLLGVTKDKAMYVGNADEDDYSARNAEVLDVFIDRKEHEYPGLEPSVTIESLYELKDFLDLKT